MIIFAVFSRYISIMIYRITPPEGIDVTLKLPASKSISNRALIINALINSDLSPSNLSTCDDTKVIVEALRNMPHEIDVMASGTAMRFLTAYIASLPDGAEHIVTGTPRMKKRPIGILVDALRHLGARFLCRRGGFPTASDTWKGTRGWGSGY